MLLVNGIHVMRFWTAVVMTGIGFTIGLLCGLLVHLPAESLPTLDIEAHHLSRVRRAAQLDRPDATYMDLSYVDGKQVRSKDYMNGDYLNVPVEKQDKQGYQVINNERPTQNNAFNIQPKSNPDSVVYVNPIQQKLVLDNSVNNANDSNRTRITRVFDSRVDNGVRLDTGDVTGRPAGQAKVGQPIAGGQLNLAADKTQQGNYRKDLTKSDNSVITTGVFWSDDIEQTCPQGFSATDVSKWRHTATNEKFLAMNEGCGRMQNRILTLQSSGKACARYRLNVDQIQGEIYSYYLSKLLGINNVPPSVLHLADSSKDQWRMVGEEVANARWSEEKPVILSQWINNLSPAYIPREFRNLSRVLTPREVSRNTRKLDNKLDNSDSQTSVCELLQWSDLIIFDYLTANLDRVVNNLFNLQWNDKMMSKPAHNLEKTSDGRLIFLDNESGLFHGYRLLDKYAPYHESLLNSVCVFRKTTIDSIKRLVQTDSINDSIQALFENSEPLHRNIPRIPAKNIKILKSRMYAVLRQVQKCESQV